MRPKGSPFAPPPPPPPARPQAARPAARSDRLDPTRSNDDNPDHTADGWRRTGRHTRAGDGRPAEAGEPVRGAHAAPAGRAEDEWAYDEVVASDVEWGEPVWRDDAAASSPPPTAVDWRKSIPREFVARSSVTPARPDPSAPDAQAAAPANGHSRAVPPAPGAHAVQADQDDDTGGQPARHLGGEGQGQGRTAGVNGANGTAQRPHDAPTGGATGGGRTAGAESVERPEPAERPAESAPGPGPSTGPGTHTRDDDTGHGIDDASPWNELDREIARALAATLAGKLARYVHSPILPLVADELTRLLKSPPPLGNTSGAHRTVAPAGAEDRDPTGDGPVPDERPRHFGDGRSTSH